MGTRTRLRSGRGGRRDSRRLPGSRRADDAGFVVRRTRGTNAAGERVDFDFRNATVFGAARVRFRAANVLRRRRDGGVGSAKK